jgi:acetyl-CoA carboxylase carboxyltransferase component
VPQLCCLLGPSAAGGAYMPAFTDWVGMVDGNASMYLASPRVAEKVTGEQATIEEMGGAMMHATVSGCCDEVFRSEVEVIAAVRLLLSYLPDSWNATSPLATPVPPARTDWREVIPREESAPFDITEVIDRLVDAESFFEIKARWAQEVVVGLARLDGRVVGIVANQPKVRSGAIFVDSADKAARFISMCDAFNIPLVFIHDAPGFMVGVAVERQGIIRHGAKMITAMSSAEVPKFSVIVRKSYAAAYYAMCAPGFGPRASIALPGVRIGPMSAEASVNAMYANKISDIEDADERRAYVRARTDEQEADLDLLHLASEIVVDAIAEPEDLRAELIARVAAADGWSRGPQRRHHNISPV